MPGAEEEGAEEDHARVFLKGPGASRSIARGGELLAADGSDRPMALGLKIHTSVRRAHRL